MNLKACVRYFVSNFYFTPEDSAFKTMNNFFLFYLKSSFRSLDIQIFVFPSSNLFAPVSHCFSCWSKINLEIYDVINCLKKNLTTYFFFFFWYLEKKKSYDIDTLAIGRVFLLIRNFLWTNHAENVHQS